MAGLKINRLSNDNYKVMLSCLRDTRKKQGFTQIQLANTLGIDQSYISKIERGERRLDVVELVYFCRALGIEPTDFIKEFENRIRDKE